jgi:hypothetical protein
MRSHFVDGLSPTQAERRVFGKGIGRQQAKNAKKPEGSHRLSSFWQWCNDMMVRGELIPESR